MFRIWKLVAEAVQRLFDPVEMGFLLSQRASNRRQQLNICRGRETVLNEGTSSKGHSS